MAEYTQAQRASFQAKPCPECGGKVRFHWIESTSASDVERKWMPAHPKCSNVACSLSDPSVADFGGYFD